MRNVCNRVIKNEIIFNTNGDTPAAGGEDDIDIDVSLDTVVIGIIAIV
jgi:hypothetical protein